MKWQHQSPIKFHGISMGVALSSFYFQVFMGPEMGNIKRNFMGYLKGCHVFFGVKIHEKPINLDQENPVKNH